MRLVGFSCLLGYVLLQVLLLPWHLAVADHASVIGMAEPHHHHHHHHDADHPTGADHAAQHDGDGAGTRSTASGPTMAPQPGCGGPTHYHRGVDALIANAGQRQLPRVTADAWAPLAAEQPAAVAALLRCLGRLRIPTLAHPGAAPPLHATSPRGPPAV